MDPKLYLEVVNQASQYKINARNDSELVRKIFNCFLNEIPSDRLLIDQLKAAISKKNTVIEELQNEIKDLKLEKLRRGKKKHD